MSLNVATALLRMVPLALLAFASPVVMAGDWLEEKEAGIYLFRAEFPLKDLAGILEELERQQSDIEKALNVKCQDKPIQIHLFQTKTSYRNYLAIRVPEGTKRQALYVPGTDAGRVYVYRHAELSTDLRHEVTHALLKNALPFLPIWLDEGLAEYFEVAPALRAEGTVHAKSLRWAVRFGWRPNLEQLEAKSKLAEMGRDEYRDAWGVVHFLLHGPKAGKAILASHLKEIQSGEVPTPISRRLATELPGWERLIVDHFR